jgi:hypothetical protein
MSILRATAALSALLLAGCPGAIDDPAPFIAARMDAAAPVRCPDGVSVTALLAARCGTAGCHDATTQIINLDLASAGVASRMIGQRSASCGGRALMDPNDPERSALLVKVRPRPACGDRMPLGAPALSDAEIACVRAWIIRRGEETDAGAGPTDAGPRDATPGDLGARDDLSR